MPTQRGLLQIMDALPIELLDMIRHELGFKDKLSFSIANGKEAYATFTETNAATIDRARHWFCKDIRDGPIYYYMHDLGRGGSYVRWLKLDHVNKKERKLVLIRCNGARCDRGLVVPVETRMESQCYVKRILSIKWAPVEIKMRSSRVWTDDIYKLYRPEVVPYVHCDKHQQDEIEWEYTRAFADIRKTRANPSSV